MKVGYLKIVIGIFLHASLSTDEVAVLSNVTAFGIPSGPIFLDRVICDGEEDTLMDCEYDQIHMCTHDLDVAIICHRKCFPLTNVCKMMLIIQLQVNVK